MWSDERPSLTAPRSSTSTPHYDTSGLGSLQDYPPHARGAAAGLFGSDIRDSVYSDEVRFYVLFSICTCLRVCVCVCVCRVVTRALRTLLFFVPRDAPHVWLTRRTTTTLFVRVCFSVCVCLVRQEGLGSNLSTSRSMMGPSGSPGKHPAHGAPWGTHHAAHAPAPAHAHVGAGSGPGAGMAVPMGVSEADKKVREPSDLDRLRMHGGRSVARRARPPGDTRRR